MTITEKIMAHSAGVEEVVPGQLLNAKIGLAYTMDYLGKVVFDHLRRLGAEKVFDADKVVIVFDHQVPAPDSKWADLHNVIRREAKEYGIRLYDIGEHGMMHQIVVQEGQLIPGIIAIGTDSHALTGGAVGAVVMGMGATDAVVAMATGELWMRVPEPVKVIIQGDFLPGVMARDVMSYLFLQKGWDGSEAKWTYRAIEFAGPGVRKMNMDERLSLCNLLSDSGAKNGIIAPDEITLDYVKPRAKSSFQVFQSDPDASYEEVTEVDVSEMEAQIACPHSPDNVKPLSQVAGTKVNVAFIGSCTNGRLGDLRTAAQILKGRKVHPGVRLTVSPASQSIYNQAMAEGLFSTLSEAGALIAPSSCGPCFGGQLVILGEGDVAISSTARNLKGRMGSPGAEIYSANPAVVAASAIAGEIADPKQFF
jgi:homoaconitate hydratase family protein